MPEETKRADDTAPKQRGVPFEPGHSGNPAGRPKGSRSKLGEAFIAALHDDFQDHGVAAIKKVRDEKPDAYLKVIASLLPAQFHINVSNDLTDAELDQRIRQLAAALNLEVGIGGVAGGEETPARH